MKTLKRILAVVLLSLPLFAGSASAECAWVVWEMSQIQDPLHPEFATRIYNILGATGTEEECREMSKDIRKILDKKKSSVVMYYCLPDTVDPRGPKSR